MLSNGKGSWQPSIIISLVSQPTHTSDLLAFCLHCLPMYLALSNPCLISDGHPCTYMYHSSPHMAPVVDAICCGGTRPPSTTYAPLLLPRENFIYIVDGVHAHLSLHSFPTASSCISLSQNISLCCGSTSSISSPSTRPSQHSLLTSRASLSTLISSRPTVLPDLQPSFWKIATLSAIHLLHYSSSTYTIRHNDCPPTNPVESQV